MAPKLMKNLLTFLLFIVSTLGLHAQDEGFTQKANALIEAKMKEYQIPGLAVAVVKGSKIIYAKGHGVANVETQKPVTELSVFHTASVSKLFTALAIMELVIENKLSLEDRLTEVIPSLSYKKEAVEAITIRQLLNHTSGLPDIWNYQWTNGHTDENALRTYLENKKLRLASQPGAEYKYSNLGYDLLGLVVEQVTGKTFESYIKEQWLSPSGMINSDFYYPNITEKRRTSPHTLKGKTTVVRKTYPYTREHAPSSTLNSNVVDLSLWMIRFMKTLQKSDHKATYWSMLKPTPEHNYMGLGFQLGEINGQQKAGHYGGDKGYRSYLFMIPDKELGFVLLANGDHNEDIRQEVLHPLATALLDQ